VYRTGLSFAGKCPHCGTTKSGGRKPPRGTRASSFGKKRSVLPVRYSNHGGLTPAALVNERSCIAQVAVSPANVRTAEPPRAGGVSPPWHASILIRQETLGVAGALLEPRRADVGRSRLSARFRVAIRTSCSERTLCTKSGWCKPAVVRGASRSAKSVCDCGGDTEPRQADVGRSCK
jgi:hypothetical protein